MADFQEMAKKLNELALEELDFNVNVQLDKNETMVNIDDYEKEHNGEFFDLNDYINE